AVIAPQHRTVGLTDTVRRISVGAADNIPYVQVVNLGRTLDRFKELGIWLVGTGDEESELIYNVNLTGPLCFVMGSEAEGIRNKTGRKCDHLVQIPMNGTVDCLNVSVAAGVCLFEAVRQRL
ncbi:MAG: TrmH family RNA methyltransferase, partial [Puniceicoccales bacterium]